MGDTLIDGSGLLQQQETFGGRSKVQQVVQQRLLPLRPVITRQFELNHLWLFNAGECCRAATPADVHRSKDGH